MKRAVFLSAIMLLGSAAFATSEKAEEKNKTISIADECVSALQRLPGKSPDGDLKAACEKAEVLDGCVSVHGTRIFHFDKNGTQKNPKRILAKALIHGDETTSGVVARAWMERLSKIDPRNTWRVIPIANPDGTEKKTRYNANGVDLNRNFPTADWENQALAYWKKKMHSDKRRYPGPTANSEVETRCLMKQFDEFKPDFIISIHTPLGVLDLDGPKIKTPPAFRPLPWTSLGNFPGSLGRYMWKDRNVPVLTIELKHDQSVSELEAFDKLQDISGTVAIQADQLKPKATPTPTKKKPEATTQGSDTKTEQSAATAANG